MKGPCQNGARTKTIPFRRFFSRLNVFPTEEIHLSPLQISQKLLQILMMMLLSIMAGETSGFGISKYLATEASFKTATTPVRAPVEPIQAPLAPTKAPTESIKTSDKAENSTKSSDDHGPFDPVAKSTSWKQSASFSKFLDTTFWRILHFILPAISCYFG